MQPNHTQQDLLERIAADLATQGYTIQPQALPAALAQALAAEIRNMPDAQFEQAGVGRQQGHQVNDNIRSDSISWISKDTPAGEAWLAWADELQTYLNRRLFMGLFSFESHFAQYRAGDFYQRHLDAFQGQSNRVLSMVVYLNPDWDPQAGGEMVLYQDEGDKEGQKVVPELGTMALFLSEEFPHEVLPATKDRYSIAGWFRVNSSSATRIDPPQ